MIGILVVLFLTTLLVFQTRITFRSFFPGVSPMPRTAGSVIEKYIVTNMVLVADQNARASLDKKIADGQAQRVAAAADVAQVFDTLKASAIGVFSDGDGGPAYVLVRDGSPDGFHRQTLTDPNTEIPDSVPPTDPAAPIDPAVPPVA